MSFRVAITPDAVADILNARAWYDSQEIGVGDKFYFAFEERIYKALEIPLSPRAWGRRTIRKVRIPKFPYSAYYEIVDNELRILAVVHGARDPKYLNYRLR